MEKQQKNRHARATEQVEKMRRMYEQMGEPLPADVIAELYQYLGAALQTMDALQMHRERPIERCSDA